MERNALLLYLKNIRDLEFEQIKIQQRINEYNSSFSKKIDSLCQTDYATLPEKPSKHTNGPFLILLGIGLELLCVYMTLIEKSGHPYRIDSNKIGFHYLSMYESSPGFASFLFLSMTAISIFLIHLGANKIKSAKDELKEYEQLLPACIEHNKNEDIRLEKNQQLINEILIKKDDYEKYMKGQYVTVSNLLNDYYNMNLLPNPYRNLASVYYIYDYMSSSQESLQDTFVHEHMENGIQRIISKLDYIIEQNEQIIFSNRILESQNESIKQQNCNMLSSLENIENNSVLCAQYAELAANYTKANAYFSLASYLQNI